MLKTLISAVALKTRSGGATMMGCVRAAAVVWRCMCRLFVLHQSAFRSVKFQEMKKC